MLRPTLLMTVLLIVAASSGCTSVSEQGTCVPGRTVACVCTDGRNGARTCGAAKTYGECICSGGGQNSDLSGADLSGADLSGADLSGADMATVTEDQACTLQAQAVCSQISRCEAFSYNLIAGDMTYCTARYKLLCTGETTLNGARISPSDIARCAGALASETCADFLTGNSPAACRVPGTLGTGSACGSSVQCASNYCTGGAVGCGVCANRAPQGSSCTAQTFCDYGLYCSGTGTNRTCIQYVGLGASCSVANNLLCLPTLSCQNGQCTAPLATGSSCNQTRDGMYGGCDGLQGVFCSGGANGKCMAVTTATAGQACPSGTYCVNASTCFAGKCVAQAADNAACNLTSGPTCMAVANCTAGQCTLSDPSTCR